jgi:hypothetical protein
MPSGPRRSERDALDGMRQREEKHNAQAPDRQAAIVSPASTFLDNSEDHELRAPPKKYQSALSIFREHGFEAGNCPIHVSPAGDTQ